MGRKEQKEQKNKKEYFMKHCQLKPQLQERKKKGDKG